LPCCPALLYFLLHILNCFIEQINDDDDDDDFVLLLNYKIVVFRKNQITSNCINTVSNL